MDPKKKGTEESLKQKISQAWSCEEEPRRPYHGIVWKSSNWLYVSQFPWVLCDSKTWDMDKPSLFQTFHKQEFETLFIGADILEWLQKDR